MRTNLNKAIEKYLESKRDIWSDRTLPVVRACLTTMASHFDNPSENYKRLIKAGRKKYTIKQYFITAGRFEEEVYGRTRYKDFIRLHRSAFRNCYKEKTRSFTAERFVEFKALYEERNPAMYNLLVLMGEAGLRVSEALNVTWEDVTEQGYLKIIGKGDKQRLVPFDSERLLGERRGAIVKKPLAYRFLFRRDLQPYTPHDFRAHYATTICTYYPELNIKDVATLLGHVSILTTQKYMRSDVSRIDKIMQRGRAK